MLRLFLTTALLTSPFALGADAIETARNAPRLRAGVGLGGEFSWIEQASATPVGLSLELGVQLSDRMAIYARGTLGSLVWSSAGSASALFEFSFDPVSLSTGVGLIGVTQSLPSRQGAAMLIPVVIGFAPYGRGDTQLRREGLHFWLEGGLAIPIGGGSHFAGGTFGVRVGYAWR
jgi:hypothetical protein